MAVLTAESGEAAVGACSRGPGRCPLWQWTLFGEVSGSRPGRASDCRGNTRKVLLFLAWARKYLGKERGQQCHVPQKSRAGEGSGNGRPWIGESLCGPHRLTGRSPTSSQISTSDIWFPRDVYLELRYRFLCLKYCLRRKHVKHTTFP